MGLFDFVKDAGKKLGLGDDEPQEKTTGKMATVDEDELRKVQQKRRTKVLEKSLRDQGFSTEGITIQSSGDRVRVTGRVATQSDREKLVLALGNNAGVAQVEEGLEVEQVEPEATFYTVVSGDTLGKIAKAHYGNAAKYPVIFEANKPLLSDPDKIYPGQVLRIPPIEG